MTKAEARALKKGDKIVDEDGNIYPFIDLDEDENLHVVCRAVYGGIYLYSDGCRVHKS